MSRHLQKVFAGEKPTIAAIGLPKNVEQSCMKKILQILSHLFPAAQTKTIDDLVEEDVYL